MLSWVRSPPRLRLRSRSEECESPSPTRPGTPTAGQHSALHASCLKVSAVLSLDSLPVGADAPSANDFGIFDAVPAADREELLGLARGDARCRRAMGAMVGLAVADSVGHMFEFLPVGDKGSHFDRKTLNITGELNRFKLKPGQWTDDSAMSLCVADSLLVRGGYDGADMRVRFWSWWNRGYNNAFRREPGRTQSVGLGGNISMSLMAIQDGSPPPRFVTLAEDAGNGSLMRLAPVPIYFHQDIKLASRMSAESSYTTHPGAIAADACGFMGFVIVRAITRGSRRVSAAQFLDTCIKEYVAGLDGECPPSLAKLFNAKELPNSTERCWNWRDAKGPYLLETLANRGMSYNGYPVSPGYFGSYSMDGLAVALHCIYHTSSFMEAIAKCINFLGDADSTGAICGQMAGAFYGLDAVDKRLVERLERWDGGEIALRAAMLYGLGLNLEAEVREAALKAAETPNSQLTAFVPQVLCLPVDEPPQAWGEVRPPQIKEEKANARGGEKKGKKAGAASPKKAKKDGEGGEAKPLLADDGGTPTTADDGGTPTTASPLNTMSPPMTSSLESEDVTDVESERSDHSPRAGLSSLRCCNAAQTSQQGKRLSRRHHAQILPAMAPLPARGGGGKQTATFPDGVMSL